MSTYYLAAPPPAPPLPTPRDPIPQITLESMNGRHVIPLDGLSGWIRMPGATGFSMPPVEVISESQPDVDGATVKEVRVLPRPVFLPIYCRSDISFAEFQNMKDHLRHIIDPKTGKFKIVGKSTRAERELIATYTGGLEGSDELGMEGASWGKLGINAVAYQPFAQRRTDTVLEFANPGTSKPLIGAVGGSDAPWPPVMASGAVIGSDMQITVDSDVPIFPVLEIVGPMSSFEGDLSALVTAPDGDSHVVEDQDWYMNIPLGVPALQTFRIDTDPNGFSARLNGALAAGRISLGSTLRAFHPGLNVLNVVASGSTSATRVRLSWRDRFWSLW